MAELYENPKHYVTAGGAIGDSANGEPTVERMLADLSLEEREEAMQYITAPPSGEEIMRAMQERNSRGEVMNMTLDQYRLFKAHNKNKETDVIAGIGEAAGTVFDEIQKAAGSIVDNPVDAVQKLTPSVVEAFAQGTRNLYGMAAQSADPTSVFFRMKNALQANGDDEEAELQQFMEAQAFNVHSMRLMTGQDTIIMDKDVINPEMTQVMSYIADPTLFIPFGGLAAKGASMVGMGEKLAMAAARTQGIRNLVLGGAIKWGVGAPLEFMGGAIRNTIDFGIETGSRAIETATGVAAKDIQSAARVGAIGTTAGSAVGLEVNSALSTASRYYTGSLIARNVGEAASIYGEQMMKQGKIGRGVLGYAGQAIRDTERQGIKLTPQTKSLLKAIEAVDPLFVYADDITSGAAQGAIIGGGLGYLAGGEEGFAGGVGSGMALGAIGATAGKVVADVTGNTKIDQMAIQRKLIIEALKENGNENAIGFEAMAAMAQATGDRAFQGYIDGIIAGIDTVNPDAVFKAYNKVQYETHLKSKGIDPNTGVLLEKSRIFPELVDRTVKADVLGILRDSGNRFAGDPEGFERAIKNAPEFAKLKPVWSRLDDNAKAVILKQIKDNGDPAFIKGLRGRQLNAHWGDLAYSERLADMINSLNQKNSNSVPDKIRETLKAETRSDKKLTRRGQMLKEKLQADGYIDKDGNIRQRRLTDVEGTQGEFEASAGWAKSRDSTGRTEVVINLDKWAMDSGNRLSLAHELYHSIMLDSVFAPDYIDRLSQKLLGKFDPKTGRVLEQALVAPDELMKFFGKYIENDPSNRGDAETIKRKKEELKKSIEDYRTRGTANRVADATAIPLEHLVEEFGAYYFSKWVKAQPIDYMFRGGEFGGIRGLMEMASDGWLDYWKGKVNENNPNFNFDAMGERGVSKAFERDGKRVSSRSLDLFMRDIVRIEANRNSNNGFDVNKLSKESREWFLKVNGLRGAAFGQLDQQGNVKKPRLRRYTAEEIRQGKEMFKVLESLPDAAHKDGMRRDGDGNWSGQPNTAQINALVGAGYIQRAWFDRMMRAYDIVNGNGSNVVEFGYLGYSAHIGDGNERVYGAAVPFKNRRAVLIGVDFKVKADGTVYSNLHTLDLKVIEARGNEVWKDPQTRELWKGNRTDMEADFYAYLSNASLPSDHPNRKPSARLLDKGDGLGGQRRDALHQMLGFHKGSDLPYINRPIAEIPVGIRHSVTTFSNDGIVNMRVDNKPRYDFNFENAHLDLSRNFMPDEMTQEKTPSGGKIIKHATGYQISKQAGTKFKVFDPEGKHLGDFDTVADAGRAAQKHFNTAHEAKTEGVDPAVPRTETPPSRQAYAEREFEKTAATYNNTFVGGKDNYVNNVKVLLDRLINGREDVGIGDGYIERAKKLRESIEKNGSIKLRELEELSKLGAGIMHDTSRLPYYNYDFFWQITGDLLTENLKKAGERYDNLYPMEIKSALHGQLAQIFQDHPNLTAQGLLKKLVTYGSRGSRFFQEATEIGLVDMLKSKIQRTTSPMRMEDGRVIQMPRGGETQPKLDMAEILDFAKSKEIRVTIEEGAKEVNNMDTSRFTLGGAKDNYKQTAIRINPEYAHGIRGHYGKDTIVHFRTTERINADGTRHLFIEEVQANNTDLNKTEYIKPKEADVAKELAKRIVANQYISKLKKAENALERKRQSVEELNQYNLRTEDILSAQGAKKLRRQKELFNIMLRNYIDAYKGNYSLYLDDIARATAEDGAYGKRKSQLVDPIRQHWLNTKKVIEDGSLFAELEKYFIPETDTKDIWRKLLKIEENFNIYDTANRREQGAPTTEFTLNKAVFSALEEIRQGSGHVSEHIIDLVDKKINGETSLDIESIYKNIGRRIPGIPLKIGTNSFITNFGELGHKVVSELADAYSKDKDIIDFLKEKVKVRKQLDAIKNDLNSIQGDISYFSYGNAEGIGYVSSERLTEILSLANTRIDKFNTQGKEPVFPLTSSKDWTLTALKGIIRQAIRDGLDKITLTHPDDSPPTSNMKPEPRRALYGKLIPEVWGSWLRKYGIELKQEGRLATDSIDKARADFTATQDKVAVANKAVLDKFNEVGSTEDPQLINFISVALATPVHEWKHGKDIQGIANWGKQLNDNAFSKLVVEAGLMKEAEYDSYVRLNKLREDGLRGTSERSTTDEGISAEAIDRGMTFELNDRIKREFLEGRINTHSMPAEDIYSGGRVYDQKSKEFLSGFVGLYAAENPDRVKGISLQFMKRADGSHRIRLTDNSKKGESADIGHITANIEGDRATLSSHINEDYRGKKLAYVVYSEMAERLRAMGVTAVDGTIVNPDGVPIKVREKIIGDTRDLYSGRKINYVEGANRIRDKQEIVGKMGGVDVTNTLYKQARYMPAEGEEPIRLSGKKKTISTKKVSTNQFETEEGIGRTYNTDSRKWTNGFIGRYAEENPDKVKFLKLSMKNWDGRTDDYGKRSIELKNGKNLVGRIDYEVKKGSGGKWLLSDPTVRVEPKYRGQGYSNLLYSEMAERARFLGAEDFLQRIENEQALPMYAQVKTFGFGESKLIDADRGQYFPPTKENFDKLKKPLIDIQKQDGSYETMEGYEPWVHSWSKIFSDRHYMPAEGINAPVNEANRSFILDTITGNDNSRRALEEGMKQAKDRKQNFITIDNINPELLRGEAVVMHSPDNAGVEPVQIGRFTVNPRGGMRFPSENPTLGWAGVKAGLGKQINENGEYNLSKGKGWSSGVGLIKGEYSKMKGTHIGLEVFLRNLQKYTDNNVLTERQTIQILKNGLGDIGDTKRPLDTIVEGILAKSAKHEAPYTIDGRRTAIEKMTETDGSASLWKYLQSDLTKLESQTDGFSSEGVTNAKQFIKALLEPMYEAVSDPLTRHAKVGEVYGYLMFRSPVTEPLSDVHPSYKYAVQPEEGGSPVQLDILSTPISARKAFTNRITAGEVSPLPESEAGFKVSTGQKHIPTMRGTFMPAEGWRDWQSERTSLGSVVKNAVGYVIMVQGDKFKVYNPYKAMVGIYNDLEQAKRRVQRDEPKR